MEHFNKTPEGLETWDFTGGLYAIFLHKGVSADAPKTYSYIFQQWLPNSSYQLDDRPHIAIMGKRYKHNEADSEEELWIPIRIN